MKLLATTNSVLPEAVAPGRFRVDLHRRLAVMMLALPPLREPASRSRPLLSWLLQAEAALAQVEGR